MSNLLKIAHSKKYGLNFCLARTVDLAHKRTGVSFVVAEETPNGLNTIYEDVVWSFQQLLGMWFTAHQTRNLYENIFSGNKHLAKWMQPKMCKLREKNLTLNPMIVPENALVDKKKDGNGEKNLNDMSVINDIATKFSGVVDNLTESDSLVLVSFFFFPAHTGYRFHMNLACNKAMDKNLRSFLAPSLKKYPIHQENGDTVFITVGREGIVFTIQPGVESAAHPKDVGKSFDILIPAGERVESLNTFLNRSATPGQKNRDDFKVGSNDAGVKFRRAPDQFFDVTFYHEKNAIKARLNITVLAAMLLASESVDEALAPHSVMLSDLDYCTFNSLTQSNSGKGDELIAQEIQKAGTALRTNGTMPALTERVLNLEGKLQTASRRIPPTVSKSELAATA